MSSLHERAGEVLLAALARPTAERDAFLAAACQGNEPLLREVASLLVFHEEEERRRPGGRIGGFRRRRRVRGPIPDDCPRGPRRIT